MSQLFDDLCTGLNQAIDYAKGNGEAILPDYYVYPATFKYIEGQEISVVFHDLGCATSGVYAADALKSARELLGITMYGMQKDGDEIPAPTSLEQIPVEKNEHTALVDVYMPPIRMARETR